MKKLLCALLAAVLTLTLMIPCTATDFAGFSDQQEIENNNAVRMLYDLGLISGYSDGSFGPQNPIRREEVAKLMALLSSASPEAAQNAASVFYDVNDSWATPYISYCAEQEIIVGSAGKFRPADRVTLRELAKMLLVNLCISLGWRGGSIFPLIFSGVAAGYAFAAITGIDPNFAVAAMTAGLYGYVSRKPVMTVAVLLMCFPPVYIFPLAGAAVIASKVPIPPKMHEEEKNCR